MLHYTSDTRLEEIANQVQVILGDYGLTEDQIRANATVHGGRLQRWAGIENCPVEEQDDLIRRVGGQIHALVLQMRGPDGIMKRMQGLTYSMLAFRSLNYWICLITCRNWCSSCAMAIPTAARLRTSRQTPAVC